VPKEGSNTFSYTLSGLYTNEHLQSGNVSSDLRSRGITTADKVLNIYDAGLAVGGPVRQDRLWFFAAIRAQGVRNQNAGIFWNRTQGTPFYTPDLDRPGDRYEYDRFYGGRFTWPASGRNRSKLFHAASNTPRSPCWSTRPP